jgi:hypothetical protein
LTPKLIYKKEKLRAMLVCREAVRWLKWLSVWGYMVTCEKSNFVDLGTIF